MTKFIQTIIEKVVQVSSCPCCGRGWWWFQPKVCVTLVIKLCFIFYRKGLTVTFDLCMQLSLTKRDTLWCWLSSIAGRLVGKRVIRARSDYVLCYTNLASFSHKMEMTIVCVKIMLDWFCNEWLPSKSSMLYRLLLSVTFIVVGGISRDSQCTGGYQWYYIIITNW